MDLVQTHKLLAIVFKDDLAHEIAEDAFMLWILTDCAYERQESFWTTTITFDMERMLLFETNAVDPSCYNITSILSLSPLKMSVGIGFLPSEVEFFQGQLICPDLNELTFGPNMISLEFDDKTFNLRSS